MISKKIMSKRASTNSEEEDPALFSPLPWQLEALRDTSPIVLCTGSAGGGKSRTIYEKAHAFCLKYPGANVVVLRKTAEDLKQSVIPTLDDIIIRLNSTPYVRKVVNVGCYIYSHHDPPSRLWWRGIKGKREREALRSIGAGGSLDMAIMEEAIEFEEDDFNAVTSRMRGKAASWRQIILATNPGPPLHWINRRLINGGEASVHISRAVDNVHNPEGYAESLLTMTGIERSRMALGLWVEGTGLVIDTWENKFNKSSGSDNGGNVTLSAEYIEGGGEVVAFVDDGYVGEWDKNAKMFKANSHPRVILLAQRRANGQVAVFYESYKIKTRYKEHIDEVFEVCRDNGWRRPYSAYYDKSAAALKGALYDAGFTTFYPSPSSRDESIKIMKEACGADENGFRSVIVHPRCHQLQMEMASWSIVNGKAGKQFDHGPDALRYGVWHIFSGIQGGVSHTQEDNEEVVRKIDEKMKRIDEILAETERRIDDRMAGIEV